ncbi:hypothetical protein [Nostoc sp.]|uniref:hypothetical protein n=1 Tax=Nostoc sp. TaxID=1180 RepID=UPI00359363D4
MALRKAETLVDAALSNPPWFLAENQDCGVEREEGSFSAAPVAQNEFSSTSAMANQTQGQVQQGYSASLRDATRTLLVEKSVSGVEVKTVNEGEGCAVSVPNAEKWSHEAIVARSNMRPERMQKLKLAANSSFDFLQECWNDDPALVSAIKKLQAKFPQWNNSTYGSYEVHPQI